MRYREVMRRMHGTGHPYQSFINELYLLRPSVRRLAESRKSWSEERLFMSIFARICLDSAGARTAPLATAIFLCLLWCLSQLVSVDPISNQITVAASAAVLTYVLIGPLERSFVRERIASAAGLILAGRGYAGRIASEDQNRLAYRARLWQTRLILTRLVYYPAFLIVPVYSLVRFGVVPTLIATACLVLMLNRVLIDRHVWMMRQLSQQLRTRRPRARGIALDAIGRAIWHHDWDIHCRLVVWLLVGCMLLACFVWMPTALAFGVLAFYCLALYAELGLHRRRANAPAIATFRRPNLLLARFLLPWFFGFELALMAGWILVTGRVAGGAPPETWWIIGLAMVVAADALSELTISLIKAGVVRRGFRIVVFRRFTPDAVQHRLRVTMPLLGAFGYLITFKDPTLSPRRPFVWLLTSRRLVGWEYLMRVHHSSDGSVEATRPTWEQRVRFELTRTDLVVFDWPTAVTPTLVREFNWARELIPQERLIFVVSPEAQGQLHDWLVQRGLTLPTVLPRDKSLTRELIRAVSQLREKPRSPVVHQ